MISDRTLSRVAAKLASDQAKWKYFHLSRQDLGDEFTFTPSVPDDAFHDDYGSEDFTTERVSLAPTVDGALESLPSSGEFFVYGVESALVYKPKRLPRYRGYDPDDMWNWGSYAEAKGIDFEDEEKHAEVVRGRIPDPETGEVWSLQPIRMKKVGLVHEDGSVDWL